jgi:hypothetical protein
MEEGERNRTGSRGFPTGGSRHGRCRATSRTGEERP